MTLRYIVLCIWSISLLATYLNASPDNENPHPIEGKAFSSNEEGQFTIHWNVNIGDKASLLETSYLKVGLEQSIKDFINLKIMCDPTKRNVKTAFRSLSIRKISTFTGKQQILSGSGKCNGDPDTCKKSLQEKDSKLKKTRSIEKTSIQKSSPCENFETTTLFDLFDEIFVDGLFFNYNVDLEDQKNELKDSLELDFNVSFLPTKSASLEPIEEVDLSFKRMVNATSNCSKPQCKVQKEIVFELFRYFGVEVDESLHECEHNNIMCHEDDLVKYIRIGE